MGDDNYENYSKQFFGKLAIKNSKLKTYTRDIHIECSTIQMKLILLCVWAEPAVLGSTKTALKFKYEI